MDINEHLEELAAVSASPSSLQEAIAHFESILSESNSERSPLVGHDLGWLYLERHRRMTPDLDSDDLRAAVSLFDEATRSWFQRRATSADSGPIEASQLSEEAPELDFLNLRGQTIALGTLIELIEEGISDQERRSLTSQMMDSVLSMSMILHQSETLGTYRELFSQVAFWYLETVRSFDDAVMIQRYYDLNHLFIFLGQFHEHLLQMRIIWILALEIVSEKGHNLTTIARSGIEVASSCEMDHSPQHGCPEAREPLLKISLELASLLCDLHTVIVHEANNSVANPSTPTEAAQFAQRVNSLQENIANYAKNITEVAHFNTSKMPLLNVLAEAATDDYQHLRFGHPIVAWDKQWLQLQLLLSFARGIFEMVFGDQGLPEPLDSSIIGNEVRDVALPLFLRLSELSKEDVRHFAEVFTDIKTLEISDDPYHFFCRLKLELIVKVLSWEFDLDFVDQLAEGFLTDDLHRHCGRHLKNVVAQGRTTHSVVTFLKDFEWLGRGFYIPKNSSFGAHERFEEVRSQAVETYLQWRALVVDSTINHNKCRCELGYFQAIQNLEYLDGPSDTQFALGQKFMDRTWLLGAVECGSYITRTSFGNAQWRNCAEAAEKTMSRYEIEVGFTGEDKAKWQIVEIQYRRYLERVLHHSQGVAAQGAYSLIRIFEPARAIEVLEKGQGILLQARLLAARETFVTARQHFPDLIEEYERALKSWVNSQSMYFEKYKYSPKVLGSPLTNRWSDNNVGAQDSRLRQTKQALERALGRPLLPGTTFDEVRALSRRLGQPVVYLLSTERGGMALVVWPEGEASHVELDNLTTNNVQVWLERLKHFASSGTLRGEQLSFFEKDGSNDGQNGRGPSQVVDELGNCLQDLKGIGDCHLIPTGELSALPLCATFSIIFNVAVTVSMSAKTLALSLEHDAPEALTLTVVANPSPCSAAQKLHLPDLPGAQAEAELLAKDHGAQVFVGRDANRNALRSALRSDGIVHLSAHGVFDFNEPLLSAILLADEKTDEPSYFSLAELGDNDPFRARLVFLASCWMGARGATLPDEAIGFPAFLCEQGVGSVIAPLWPIDDEVAKVFVKRFYGIWEKSAYRDRPAAVLHKTFRSFGNEGIETWSAFTVTGV